jgi:ribosomal protein L19E
MKSIQQQLQSRISLRRNTIRHYEQEVEVTRHIISLIGTMGLPQLKDKLRGLRNDLRYMRGDQKLDKVLYSRLVNDGRWEKAWKDGWKAVTVEA